jgi:hypothetical protein
VRIPKYALALIFSAGALVAANSFGGNWKMDHDGSKYSTGNVPKNETMAISDQSDKLAVAVTGTDDNGKPIAIHYIIPVSGGDGQMQQGDPYNGYQTSAQMAIRATRRLPMMASPCSHGIW